MPETICPPCSMLEADICLFPFFKKTAVDYEKFLPSEVQRESIAGVANLPPYFPNRLGFFNKYGKTFFGKNIPLVFSFLDYPELEKTTVDKFWDQVMLISQKGDCPRVWILAPGDLCKYMMSTYVKETSGFYLHWPDKEVNHYFSIANNGGKINAHFLF